MTDDVTPLDQQIDTAIKRHGSLGAYKEYFVRLNEIARANELHIFNRAFDDVKPLKTKEYAGYVQLRRELTGLDDLLRSANR